MGRILLGSFLLCFAACGNPPPEGPGSGGECVPHEGDCPNICDAGPQGIAQSCGDELACGCGLECAPAFDPESSVQKLPKDGECPNIYQGGTGGLGSICETSDTCLCGYDCVKGVCIPYEDDDVGCTCGKCVELGAEFEGCNCTLAEDQIVPEPEEELLPGQICKPDSVIACVIEGSKQAVFCNKSGTGQVEGICTGSDGLDSQCIDNECTTCFPGTRKCEGEDLVVQCSQDGSVWESYQECLGGTTGQVCTGQTCESLCSINIKFNSYIGCDYWGVDLDNAFVPGGEAGYFDANGAQYAIAVANPPDAPLPATVDVWYKEGEVEKKVPLDSNGEIMETVTLEPGGLHVYELPRRDANGTLQAALAYRVTSSVPIIAYQFNPLTNEEVYSNDASLLLPATLLGRDYTVMTREQTFDTLRGYLTVVAVLPGETTVSVQVAASTMAGYIYEGTPDEQDIPHMEPGETRIFKLQQYDVLNIETDSPGADLTGSKILSDQRVAVFGGSEAANAPNTARCVDIDPVTEEGVCIYDGTTTCKTLLDCLQFNTCCADHLEQQLFPVKTWGVSYVASKSFDRGKERDIWRIMAAEDNTHVVLVPPQQGVSVPILNKGEWYEFESQKHFEIHAQGDKPILVGQFLAAQDAPDPNVGGTPQSDDAGTGDPAFMLAVPVQQYRNDYVIFTPGEYADNYVNVTAPTGAVVTIDGEEIPA
ncbi:MAG: IgGFc-binding protein, partial [Myxococcota bacterium]|nr:IgGFc-binding protein [Myxococcota bacterium]